jgi:formylglycine-generating enzyme required for sulfatase activity
MWGRTSRLALAVMCCLYLAQSAPAACPSADLSGDCFVDFEDFAILAAQWPTTDFNDIALMAADWLTPDPRIPDDITYIPGGTFEMGDNLGDGNLGERPVHTVTLDSFYIGKYEITNRQYCDYLNSAKLQGLIELTGPWVFVYKPRSSPLRYPYCDTHSYSIYSQIDYSDGVFTVRSKSGRDMSNDPMVTVAWYGTVAYCNWRSQHEGKEQCYDLSTWNCDFSKKGYRLATEAEWEYAARGGFSGRRFPWGDTITHSQANYYSSSAYPYDASPTREYHPAWNDGISPYTSPGGSFAANGYGLYDMPGNVSEWCNDWLGAYSATPETNPTGPIGPFTLRVFRDGSWSDPPSGCRVASRGDYWPDYRSFPIGFRVVLDLN